MPRHPCRPLAAPLVTAIATTAPTQRSLLDNLPGALRSSASTDGLEATPGEIA